MGQDSPSDKTMVTKGRRSRTSFTEEQLEILVQAFSQNPYPGYTAKQRLAVEINAEESRIQIWFQNRRARHGFLKRPKKKLDPSKDHASPKEKIQDGRDRRCRTSYTSSQLQTLKNAFTENPYPGIDSREQLAEKIGVPESRVQLFLPETGMAQKDQEMKNIQEKTNQNTHIAGNFEYKSVLDLKLYLSETEDTVATQHVTFSKRSAVVASGV
ncbi:hypothetical protein JEQ12_005775 [Ovis aries]|uniref:Homeobox domain-containing protein n=1 Tax=Ovis aries TaxID=9940 RepID=A0A835ZVY7_SHEEP|nr:hypothetical protein JEQ12_005775 [Ovis aries]